MVPFDVWLFTVAETEDTEFATNITAKCAGTLELLVVDVGGGVTSENDWTLNYECYSISEAAPGNILYLTR